MLRRLAWPAAIVAVLLGLAAAFFVGRETDSGDDAATTSTGPSPGQIEARKASKIVGHIDASDVVKTFPPQVLTDGDVDTQKKGTPGRAFLEWWQAYQWHDVPKIESLTSKETLSAVGADNLAELVSTQSLQGVELLDVSESGSSATVSAGLLNFQPSSPGGPIPNKPTNSVPDTFLMTKEQGDWLFAQTDFVQLKVDNLQQ
jgi:hypothetical protein